MENKSNLVLFHEEYNKQLNNLETEFQLPNEFYQAYLKGNNKVYQKYIKETKEFDEEWVKTIESYIPSLNKITMNPKNSLKIEKEIVAVEKARKINSESIRHLAQNTHLVKEVRDGFVIPNKLQTSFSEIDYHIYENKFVMTLITRIMQFTKSRYELIKENIISYEKRHFNLESEFDLNDTNIKLNIDLLLTDELEAKHINEYNKKLLIRIEQLNKNITTLYSSKFMEMMIKQPKVKAPIMKTNILMKDVDYKNAYLLWLFLDRYNTMAFNIDTKEKNLTFSQDYLDQISKQVLTTFTTVVANQLKSSNEYDEILLKNKRRKSVKVVTKHKDNIDLDNKDNYQMEDNAINEYYLEANKRLFKQSLDYHGATTKTYETSVKRALRETLNISNALYDSFFELEDNDDIFSKLVTEVDVTKELTEARRKALVAKMIREVKEVDYNNAVRKEKQLLKDISKYNGLILKESKEQTKLKASEINKINRLEKEKIKTKELTLAADNRLLKSKESKEALLEYRKNVNEEINAYKKQLDLESKEYLDNYKKELAEVKRVELALFKDKERIRLAKLNDKHHLEVARLKDKLKEEKIKAKKANSNKLSKNKKMIDEKGNKKVAKQKSDYTKSLSIKE